MILRFLTWLGWCPADSVPMNEERRRMLVDLETREWKP